MIGIRTNGEVCGGEETTPKQRVVCTRDIVIVATTGEERLEAVVGGDTLSQLSIRVHSGLTPLILVTDSSDHHVRSGRGIHLIHLSCGLRSLWSHLRVAHLPPGVDGGQQL